MTKRDLFVCLRCLQDDVTIKVTVPDQVIKECSRCGTENWCVATERTDGVEATKEEQQEAAKRAADVEPEVVAETVEADESSKASEAPDEPSGAEKKKAAKIAKIRAELAELEK